MEAISFTIDIALIIMGVLATFYAWQVGGSIGHNSLQFMAVGFLVLGIAHFLETLVLNIWTQISTEDGEIIHRVVVLVGFALLLVGYQRLAKFVKS